MGYNIKERSKEIQKISLQKWLCRKEGKLFEPTRDENRKLRSNLCKNQPRSMIKYINMQTALCSTCRNNNIITRCSQEHLENIHDQKIDSVQEIISKIAEWVENTKVDKSKQN